MTKTEYYNNQPTIAYYSGLDGLEIKKIEYGFDDYVICISGVWYGTKQYHRVKIYYDTKTPYFRIYGYRIPLDECIRTNI